MFAASREQGAGGMSLSERVAANALIQVIAQVLSAGLSFLGLAFTTRYLSVAQFGEIQAALALTTMFQFMGDLGLSTIGARALARAPEGETAAITAGLFTVSAGFTGLLVGASLAATLAAYPGAHSLARHAALILLIPLLLTPWVTVARAHAVWRQRAWLPATIMLGARLISVAAVIAAAQARTGPESIAVAYTLGTGLAGLGIAVCQREALTRPRWRLDARARSLAGAGLALSVITVINAVYFRLDAFLLSLLATPRSVALYTLAYRVLDGLVVLPGYVLVTLVPELARRPARDPQSARLIGEALRAVWLLVLPVGAGGVLAPLVIAALGGGRYHAAGTVLALLVPSALLACLNAVLGTAMVAQGRQRPLIAVSAANLALNGLLNALLIPADGARGAAIALLATELVSLLATVALYSRTAGGPPRLAGLRRSLIAGAACAGAMGVRFAFPGGGLGHGSGGLAGSLVAAIGLGAVVYAAAVWRLGLVPASLRGFLPQRPDR